MERGAFPSPNTSSGTSTMGAGSHPIEPGTPAAADGLTL